MSKEYQGKLADKLGFPQYIRTDGLTPSNKFNTDVFESFFGALSDIGDMVFRDGIGIVLCKNMITYIFENLEEIDITKSLGSNKTQIQQIFSRFKVGEKTLGIPNEINIKRNDDSFITTIELTDDQFKFLRSNRIRINDKILARMFRELLKLHRQVQHTLKQWHC